MERTAAIAAELGFGTFILDDGWSYDEAKHVNPETIKTWYRDVGRWDAFSPLKFPDFQSHRERMRKLGLNYVVWVAPYFVGTRSEAFRRLSGSLCASASASIAERCIRSGCRRPVAASLADM